MAVGSSERVDNAKDIPTIAESGFPGFTATGWTGFVTKAGSPKESVERLNVEANRALKTAEILSAMSAQGWAANGGSADRFGAVIRSDAERYEKVVREANIKIE